MDFLPVSSDLQKISKVAWQFTASTEMRFIIRLGHCNVARRWHHAPNQYEGGGYMEDWLWLGKQAEDDEEYEQAAAYYQKAADAGNIDGWIALGNFYDDVVPNPEKARAAWIKVHEDDLAHGDQGAYWYLGSYYCEEGRYEEGIDYLKKAAVDGNGHQLDAEIELGDLYYKGNGATQDFGKALEWYQKAKQHGANGLDDRIMEII